MKKLLLLITLLLTSLFSYSQENLITLRFDKSSNFDELIHRFDTPSNDLGYFEFYMSDDVSGELHFHSKNNTICKTYKITNVKSNITIEDLICDKYICEDNDTKEIVELYVYTDKKFNKFNIMLSSKDNRGIIYTCNYIEIKDYKGPTLFKNLENWFIDKSIYELKL